MELLLGEEVFGTLSFIVSVILRSLLHVVFSHCRLAQVQNVQCKVSKHVVNMQVKS